jgi:hypothetical protein
MKSCCSLLGDRARLTAELLAGKGVPADQINQAQLGCTASPAGRALLSQTPLLPNLHHTGAVNAKT